MNDLSQALAALLVYFSVQPLTYTAAALGYNTLPETEQCDTFVNPRITATVTEWLIPTAFAAAILLPSSMYGRQMLLSAAAASIAVFYANIVTAVCPPAWTIAPTSWRNRLNISSNESAVFVPQAVEFQWRSAVVYTALATVLLILTIQHPENSQWYRLSLRKKLDRHARWLLAVTCIACIVLLAEAPSIDKLEVSVLCRGGLRHPEKVFDTADNAFGPTQGRGFDYVVGITLCLAAVALITTSFAHEKPSSPWEWGVMTLSRFAAVATFVATGTTLATMLNTLKNPGCTTAINGFKDDSTRAAVALLAYAWIARILCLLPSSDNDYVVIKTSFF